LNCHICNQRTETFVHEKTNITYYHCKPCEYIFKSPECYQDLQKQKERYNLHTNSKEDEGYIAYYHRFFDFILPHTKQVKTALDFGCGESLILTDIFNNMNISTVYYDPIYLPSKRYDSKKYDLIVSVEVFEHLHHPKEVFGHLFSLLNKEGYLAIQTQFHHDNIEQFLHWYYRLDPTHIVFFRPETFRYLADLYGGDYEEDNGKNMLVIQKKF